MRDARRRYDANFKAQVAMEALKGIKTMAELSSEYKLHATQIQGWKRLLQKEAVSLFRMVAVGKMRAWTTGWLRRCSARSGGWRSSWTF